MNSKTSSKGLEKACALRNTALLLIDFQTDFLAANGRWPVLLTDVPGIIKVANRLIARAGKSGVEIIYITNEYSPREYQRNGFLNGAAIKGQPGVELDQRLKVVNSNLFHKSRGNAFHKPALDRFLRARATGHLILCGVFAEECIQSTARGAFKRGYQVTVVSDAVASADAEQKQKALRAMTAMGARVVPSRALRCGSVPFELPPA